MSQLPPNGQPTAPNSATAADEYAWGGAETVTSEEPGEARAHPSQNQVRNSDGTFQSPKDAPRHDSYVVSMARDFGVPDDEIADMTPAELGRTVHNMQRVSRREANRSDIAAETLNKPAPPAAAAEEDELDWPEAVKSAVDPSITKTIRDLVKNNKALQKRLDAAEGFARAQVETTLAQQAEGVFARFPQIFGEGTRADLADDSAELKRRVRVIRLAEAEGGKGSLAQKMARVVTEMYNVKPSQAVERDLPRPAAKAKTPEEMAWLNGRLAMPTNRRGTGRPTGEQAAVETAGRKLAELRQSQGADGDTDVDGFPE